MPHCLLEFSPVLCFLGHILCLIMDGVRVLIYVVYFFSFFLLHTF
jgi:hypothetical protein